MAIGQAWSTAARGHILISIDMARVRHKQRNRLRRGNIVGNRLQSLCLSSVGITIDMVQVVRHSKKIG